MPLVAVLVSLSLIAIALLHVYWAAGGRWAAQAAVPSLDGRPLFHPSRGATLIVAFALLSAALAALAGGGLIRLPLPDGAVLFGLRAFAAVFLIRCVGDFRYVGIFKRVRGSRFSRLDTRVYSPLCLVLGLGLAYPSLTQP